MTLLKKNILIGTAIIYGCVSMFILFEVIENPLKASCGWESPCLRFCCENRTLCSETKIRETINETAIEHFDKKKFTLMIGDPRCPFMKGLKDTEQWRLSHVNFF
jgi:hypothetical protein